ncbi:MAG: glycosyltransferase family 2 protein [Desulfuromonadales bacterium]
MTNSIIVPAFNEGDNIAQVLNELMAAFPDCEIIVVDDGSSDNTYETASQYLPRTTMRHNTNRGQGASIKTGIMKATGDFVILVDGDGQHPIEGIRDIINYIRENPDIDSVLTNRENIYSSGHVRSIGKILINYVVNKLTREHIRDCNCGLRAFRRNKIIPFLFQLPNGFSYSTTSTVLSYMEDFKTTWLPITMRQRTQGVSQVRVRHAFDTLVLVFRLIVLFDPLRFFVPLCGYSFFLGILSISLSVLTNDNIGKNYIFFFLFGSLAFILGLLSEQVANMRKEIISLRHDR